MKKLIILLSISFYLNALELIDALENRATEKFFYSQINKIHNLNYYINNYIIRNGTVPTRIDLNSNYSPKLNNSSWPKTFGSTGDIRYTVDFVNKEVVYDNIVAITSNKIAKIFKYNIAHFSDSIINSHDSLATAFNIIIPFDLEVSRFIDKVNMINNAANPKIIIGSTISTSCNIANQDKTLYAPNGAGGFNFYSCIPPNWNSLSIFNQEEYTNSMSNYAPAKQNGSKVYTDINATNARIHIYDNNNMQRRLTRP